MGEGKLEGNERGQRFLSHPHSGSGRHVRSRTCRQHTRGRTTAACCGAVRAELCALSGACGAVRADITVTPRSSCCVTPMMPTQGRSPKRQIINRVNRQNQVQ